MYLFSEKMGNFEILGPNLTKNGKLPNYVQYFGSNIVESWVEVEMNSVKVDGAGWRLK